MLLDVPFAPGESPFRTKGNVYRRLIESADSRVPGGSAAVRERLDDPALEEFFDQRFLAASSYDVFPIVPFGMIGAKLTGQTYPEFVRRGAAFTAERDMNGIYKVILKLASPESVAVRLPRILMQYFDFGKIEGEFTSPRTYEARATGLPRPIAVWLMNVAHGFVPVVMAAAGARDVELAIRPPTEEPKKHGVPMVTAAFEVSWR